MPRPRNPRGDREFWESAVRNNMSWRQYFNRLIELSVSMFSWKNVPDTIDVRFMELALFSQGHVVFFYDDVMGYLCLRCALGGRRTVYEIPIDRRVITSTGYTANLDNSNSVLIFNNYLHGPSSLDVEIFSRRLFDIDRTIDVNVRAQKTPILITCDEKERLSMLNMYKQYDGNAPVITATDNLNPDKFSVLSTAAPYVADKLMTLKNQIWNEALTYLGISNMNINKKERLLNEEITKTQGGVVANRYSRLKMRQKACEEINKMFGLNISVEYDSDTIAQLLEDSNKGGELDE